MNMEAVAATITLLINIGLGILIWMMIKKFPTLSIAALFMLVLFGGT